MTIDHDRRAARQQQIANAVRAELVSNEMASAVAKQIDEDAISIEDPTIDRALGPWAAAVQSDVVWDALAQVRQVIALERNVAKCDNGDARAATISALIGSMSDRDRAELLRALIKDHAAKSEPRYQVEVATAALQSITITDRPRQTSRLAEVLETLVINAAESVQLIASQLEAVREL